MPYKKLFFSVLTLLALYWGWGKITSPLGDQIVNYTPANKECFNNKDYSFCIYKSMTGVNKNIIYHMHGRNLDENAWNDDTYYTAMIQQYWSDQQLTPPTVVSISFGPQWILTPKGSASKSGLLDLFIKSVLPAVELKTGAPNERILLGESMGGLNVLIAGLSTNGIFSRVAALCPGVYKISPFSQWSEIFESLKRTGADPKIAFGIMLFAKKYISNETEWPLISPLELVEKSKPSQTKIYLSCGLYDAYGNFEGTEYLAKKLKEKSYSVDWNPLYGGHCAIDVASLSRFLTE